MPVARRTPRVYRPSSGVGGFAPLAWGAHLGASGQRPIAQSTHDPVSRLQSHFACACGGTCPRCAGEPHVQAKLAISQPGDAFEQEAERIADQVMRIPDAAAVTTSAPDGTAQGVDAEFDGGVQLKSDRGPVSAGGPAAPASEIAIGSLGEGAPLPPSELAFFEPRFGLDLSEVRLHDDAAAAAAAQGIEARAFTLGRDIAFAPGEHAPGTAEGRRLLAHELAHVVQQARTPAAPRVMRTPYPGCDPATTGIDDADARIDRSRDEARRMAAAARAAFPRMSTRTIRLANRHFHCPSSSHIRAVMAALAAIEAMIPPLDVRCVSERTAQCRVPRYWEISNGVLKICPRVLADEFYFADVLIWALFAGAADGAGLALTCSILSPCYDDFTVPASVMVGEQYSYIGFAIELAGLPVHQAPTIPCAPFATGTYVVVPPGAVSNPTLIRPVTGFEPTPRPGSVVLTVHKDSSGNEFIYHGDLPGAEQYMPNEPKRYYFPGGRAP